MLDDIKVGIDVDLAPFTAGMATVDAVAANPPTLQLKPVMAVGAMETAQASLTMVSAEATRAQFNLQGLATAFAAVGTASQALGTIVPGMKTLGVATKATAGGVAATASSFGLLSTMATNLAVGVGLVLAPLRGLIIIPKLVAGSFRVMFAVILAPLKIMAAGLKAVATAAWIVVKPMLAIAAAVFKFKVFLASIQIQFKLLRAFLAFLPPQLRVVVVGLTALGAMGRVGSLGLKAVATAAGVAAGAVLAVKHPVQALGLAMLKSAITMRLMAMATLSAARAMVKFAFARTVAGMKTLGAATLNVARHIGGKLVGAISGGVKMFGLLLAAGAGWGIKLASDAEQAQVGFATMLKSGTQAKAVLAELEQFAASTPFQLNDLRDGAKQLLNAQVPATDLTNRLTMLGDIAAGTGKPIGDFVRIFAKVKSTGKVSLESLNQLAERGVPIYTALTSTLGVTRTEMLDMVSKGKLGFTELDAALKSTATGSGVFAGGMAAQSQTVAGLFSTLKDNVGFAMRELGGELMHAFNFKGLMANGITMFQSLKAGIASMRPAFMATATVVKAAFGAVWEVITVVFNGISSALGVTGGNFMATFMEWAAVATWAFKEWPNIAQLAFTNVSLWLVQAGADFKHLFTGVMPALFTWFGSNWGDLFTTAFDFVTTVFINLGQNIRNAMSAIWDFISSGGTSSLSMAWTPLTEGFKNTIKELPDIPDRAVGELEKSLAAQSENLAGALGNSLAAEIDNNMAMLRDFQSQTVTTPELEPVTGTNDATVDDTTSGKSTRTDFSVASLDRGSEAALKAIFAANNRGDKTPEKQLAVQKQMAGHLQTLANREPIQLGVAGAVG